MEERYRANEAYIVLGEFNQHLLAPNDEFWTATNDGVPAGLTLSVLSAKNEARCVQKYPHRIDQIVVDSKANTWLKPDTFGVVKLEQEGSPSDHCPIAAAFDIK